ncbi:MAG: DUF4011 domain-containing protein, partial [Gammaproteobacteria bacterium]|nr:DUF4011 domain-containing protein [Gammaproteobacteria bacterium]
MNDDVDTQQINLDKTPNLDHQKPIKIHLDSERIACFALQHCDVPIIRRLELENCGKVPLRMVTVEITSDPVFFEHKIYSAEIINPEQVVSLIKGDIQLKHSYLRNLNEQVRATVTIKISTENELIHEQEEPFEVLSFDQWPGTRILPELVAAFSLPNERHVAKILREASDILQKASGSGSFDGYQSGNRKRVTAQMMAIYTAIARKDMRYINPPASFTEGQKVRLPARIMDTQMATCLDLTLLFTACLEQAGLHPVILFQKGHSWVGTWLVDNSFSADLVDDIITVRTRIDSGELLTFETTLAVANGESFQQAVAAGQKHFTTDEESQFEFAIEVSRARRHKITPLPTSETEQEQIAAIAKAPTFELDTSIEGIELPPLVTDVFNDDNNVDTTTPEGRLTRWKSKLLDLSLRNKLLNFKSGASSVPLVVPRPDELEDALARGDKLRFRPLPAHMQDGSPRSIEVYSDHKHSDLFADTAREAFQAGELLAGVGEKDLDKRLTKIFRDARTAEQEGGANTLFIALGMLRWKKTAEAEKSHLAPLILVPVTIKRPRVRGRFTLTAHDDETVVNPTILQLLHRDFGIRVLDPDNLPTDDSGVDVVRIWQLFRSATQNMKGWEVLQDTSVGLFSFTKYLMWKDLESRTEALKANPTVRHLIDRSGLDHISGDFPDPATLDDTRDPAKTFCPLICDSSQLAAIYAAAEDKSFVIEGPPGTGKSQTITNMVAHLAGSGKRVLFLSEKITALEVVKKRLVEIGLGPFLLELHSSKSGKADFAKSIKSTIEEARTSPVAEWESKASELKRLRSEINSYIRLLHKQFRNGLTPFDAIAGTVQHPDWVPAPFSWPTADMHDIQALETLRELSRNLSRIITAVGEIANHPYAEVRRQEWTPGWESEFSESCVKATAALNILNNKAPDMSKLAGISPENLPVQDLGLLEKIGIAILASKDFAPGITDVSLGQSRTLRTLEQLDRWQGKYAAATDQVAEILDASKLRGFSTDLSAPWALAKATWWPKSWLSKCKVRRNLLPFTLSGKRPSEEQFEALLEP